jgi:hypothetical protein
MRQNSVLVKSGDKVTLEKRAYFRSCDPNNSLYRNDIELSERAVVTHVPSGKLT